MSLFAISKAITISCCNKLADDCDNGDGCYFAPPPCIEGDGDDDDGDYDYAPAASSEGDDDDDDDGYDCAPAA
ncbi:conserved hypothetical protein [Ricinus communis]|uniref:Uncharacterized protein n=1 Tax=Ricinus communis TaxID=3988 RepID=B9STP2_RICCO|nr:conserved hypothetical protein [Ricinus communis]